MGYWIIDGRKVTDEEYEELERQEAREKQQARDEAARLSRQLGETYAALKEHLRRNPGMGRQVTDEGALDQQVYQNLRQNLEKADRAPRCPKIKADGTQCGSPKMKDHIYCFAHYQMLEARAEKLVLPALEDANSILMAVMLVQRALIDDEISEKKAGLLLYSLQIAAANVAKTTVGQAADEDMLTEMEEEEDALERQGREKSRRLPLINTDDTDQDGAIRMDHNDQAGERGRMLPQSAGGGGTGGAQSNETYANLCPSTREACVDGAGLG